MKIAGRKNSGAWFRTNKFLQLIRAQGNTTQIQGIIANTDGLGDYVDAFNGMLNIVGVTPTTTITAAVLAQDWAQNGIPLQIWMGVPTFQTYSKDSVTTSSGTKVVYTGDLSATARTLGINIRRQITQFMFGARQANDVIDVNSASDGNPGGLPTGGAGAQTQGLSRPLQNTVKKPSIQVPRNRGRKKVA